jgi:glycosyltransferase involved in cell wall biosynthesis
MRKTLLLLLFLFCSTLHAESRFHVRHDDIEIVVVICSYNNEKYVEENLKSLFCQEYPKWQLIYLNDASLDKTGNEADRIIYKYKMQNRCVVVHNKDRQGAMSNIFHAVHAVNPRKVVVLLDGDDMLKDNTVLTRVAKIYRNKNIWMSYGNYESYPKDAPGWHNDSCHAFPPEVLQNRSFRNYTWVAYPLRTFYAKLFHNIKENDLKYQGQFFPVVSDTGMMHPMFEMAANGHIHYEKKIMYIYRVNTGNNDFHLRKPLMDEVSNYIKYLPKYPVLKQLF